MPFIAEAGLTAAPPSSEPQAPVSLGLGWPAMVLGREAGVATVGRTAARIRRRNGLNIPPAEPRTLPLARRARWTSGKSRSRLEPEPEPEPARSKQQPGALMDDGIAKAIALSINDTGGTPSAAGGAQQSLSRSLSRSPGGGLSPSRSRSRSRSRSPDTVDFKGGMDSIVGGAEGAGGIRAPVLLQLRLPRGLASLAATAGARDGAVGVGDGTAAAPRTAEMGRNRSRNRRPRPSRSSLELELEPGRSYGRSGSNDWTQGRSRAGAAGASQSWSRRRGFSSAAPNQRQRLVPS